MPIEGGGTVAGGGKDQMLNPISRYGRGESITTDIISCFSENTLKFRLFET